MGLRDILDEAAVRLHLPPDLRSLALTVLEETDSTNTCARLAARDGATHFSVIAARSQSGGRGRMGRSFHSPGGSGLYMSVLLRPGILPARAIHLTTAAAVAVCRAAETVFGVSPGIKWVNDLYLGEKKVCGILCESKLSPDSRGMEWAVVGIGVNITAPPGGFPPSLSGIAGALLMAPEEDARARLCAGILAELYRLWEGVERTPAGPPPHMDEYRRRCNLIGKPVTVYAPVGQALFGGIAEDIDGEGRLLVRLPGGEVQAVSSGEVSVRTEGAYPPAPGKE